MVKRDIVGLRFLICGPVRRVETHRYGEGAEGDRVSVNAAVAELVLSSVSEDEIRRFAQVVVIGPVGVDEHVVVVAPVEVVAGNEREVAHSVVVHAECVPVLRLRRLVELASVFPYLLDEVFACGAEAHSSIEEDVQVFKPGPCDGVLEADNDVAWVGVVDGESHGLSFLVVRG